MRRGKRNWGIVLAISMVLAWTAISTSGGFSYARAEDKINKININTADVPTLTQLSGIGEAKAAAIVKYREEKGKFKTTEDIMNVKGIGDGLFKKIKDHITIGEAKTK